MAILAPDVTEEAWREWKRTCAAGLCSAETVSSLHRFGAHRFRYFMNRLNVHARSSGGALYHPEFSDGWHLLETHARVNKTRSGKLYKTWLFERARQQGGDFTAALESGATLIMRDAVREHLRKECAPPFMTSLNRPLTGPSGSTYTLEDLLPDEVNPADVVAEREWKDLASRHARELFKELGPREHAVLWARARGIFFHDARLQRKLKCSESLLYKIYQAVLHALGQHLKTHYPGESADALTRLACMTHAHLAALSADRIYMKRGRSRFFSIL